MHQRYLALAIVASLVLCRTSDAQVIYQTLPGSSTGGGSVDAQVSFTLSANTVSIILKNLYQNPTDDAQTISALLFRVSGASGSGTLASTNSGNVSTISSGGAYTTGVPDALTRWVAKETATDLTLTTLSGGSPDRNIIGPDSLGKLDPTFGGLYSNANPSITGHNPNVLGSATFNITVPGVTASSVLSNVVFQFGTMAGSNQVGGELVTVSAVPEPNPLYLGVLGVAFVGSLTLYKRRRAFTNRTD